MKIWTDDGEDFDDQSAPGMQFVERENLVVAVLLGPDESTLFVLRERPQIPFGFHR